MFFNSACDYVKGIVTWQFFAFIFFVTLFLKGQYLNSFSFRVVLAVRIWHAWHLKLFFSCGMSLQDLPYLTKKHSSNSQVKLVPQVLPTAMTGF